jgi:phage terminase large subunit
VSASVESAKAKLRRYREDDDGPVEFVREQLRAEPDAWQVDALRAYHRGKPRTALRACKNPGKTAVLAWASWHFLSVYPDPNIAATSISGDNLRDGLWKEMANWQQRSPFLLDQFQWTAERIFLKARPATWFMSARKWSKAADPNVQANTLAGLHQRYIMFVLDETGGMPRAVMAAADAALGSGVVAKLMQAGNPEKLEGPLYDACTSERHLWNLIEVTGDPDDPNRAPRVDRQWALDQITKYGKDSPWVLVNVFGKFPPASLNALLGIEEVQEAMKRTLKEDAYAWAQKRLGIDVARFGDDLTVLFPRQGLAAFKPVPMSHPRNSPVSVDIANRVALAAKRWKHEMEFYDDTVGWAHGAIDVRRTQGASPIAVAADRPAFDPRYHNTRALCWMNMADWVKRGGALPNVPELVAELTTPTYMFHNGKFQIEPKDEIKKRLGRSPNYADALSLTFAVPDMPGEAENMLARLGLDDRRHAKTDWDPYRDEAKERLDRAVMEFDPFERGRDSI